jgi:hypothetical protein
MGELLKRVLGSTSGKVGDLVFKYHKNGKVFISTHKGFNTISESPNCVKNRVNFNKVVKFSKAVNSLPELRDIWKASKMNGRSAYTKILSFNIKLLADAEPSLNNRISPGGFGFNTEKLALTENSVSLNIKLNERTKDYVGQSFIANFVIALFDQKQNLKEELFPFAVAVGKYLPENITDYVTVTANFDSVQKQYVAEFKKAIVYTAITKTDVKPYLHSDSFAIASDIIQT